MGPSESATDVADDPVPLSPTCDEALRQFQRANGQRLLERLLGRAESETTRHAWTVAKRALEASWAPPEGVGVAPDPGLAVPPAVRALGCHLARAEADAELDEARAAFFALVSQQDKTKVSSATPDGLEALAAIALQGRGNATRAARRWLVGAPPDQAFSADALAAVAEQFLRETDALFRESQRRLFGDPPKTILDLLRAMRSFAGSGRHDAGLLRGWADDLAPLGFGRELSKHGRVVETVASDDPRVRVVALAVPHDVRIGIPEGSDGLLSELTSGEALGRAAALCLTVPQTAAVYAWPLAGSVGRSLGVLFSQLMADGGFLRRVRGLPTREAEQVSRRVACLLLLEQRAQAAALLARRDVLEGGDDLAPGRERLERALQVSVDHSFTVLSVLTPTAHGPRFAARLSGMALADVLRERYDEDWFRNPRVGAPLRAAASRGGAVSSEELFECCASPQKLEAQAALAIGRIAELLGQNPSHRCRKLRYSV